MSAFTPHTLGSMHAVHLAQVTDNADPQTRGRIKVRLVANDLELWAPVVVPSAGEGYGFACLPKVAETVVVAFVSQDQPLVIGSLWAGENSMPEDADAVEDHYAIATPAGTVIEMDDGEDPKLTMRTRSGYSITIDEGAGGSISVSRGGQSLEMNSSEVKISGIKIVLEASTIEMKAAMIKADAGMSKFSGVVQCDTLISNAVVSTSYTPGAGNIW